MDHLYRQIVIHTTQQIPCLAIDFLVSSGSRIAQNMHCIAGGGGKIGLGENPSKPQRLTSLGIVAQTLFTSMSLFRLHTTNLILRRLYEGRLPIARQIPSFLRQHSQVPPEIF
jgi:hypothetical protein